MKKPTQKPETGSSLSCESKGHFLRELQIEFLIHEMKDPFSVIETGVRTLLEKKERFGALSPRQEKTLIRILRNTRRAQGMLNDLLEIGRSEAGCFLCCKFHPTDTIYDVLMDALEAVLGCVSESEVKRGEQHHLIEFLSHYGILLDIAPPMFHLEMYQDEIKFRQIVGNLIKNALHHRDERIEIRMAGEKELLFIEVTDDGPGIEPEHHQMIFQRYTRINDRDVPNRRGHGLGLAGALISARSIGGDIEVKSKRGIGATFRLILPITLKGGEGQRDSLSLRSSQ